LVFKESAVNLSPPKVFMPRSNSFAESWNAAIVHVICIDHLNNSHGVVNRVLEKTSKKNIGYKTVGALLIAELKHNPDQHILRPLREAIEAHATGIQNEEDLMHFQRTICEAASERLCWADDRRGNGSLTLHFKDHYNGVKWLRPNSRPEHEINICMAIITNNASSLRTSLKTGDPVNKETRYLANKQMRYFGKPLHLAARYAGAEVIQVLLDCKAEVCSLQYNNGRHVQANMLSNAGTALRVAALTGRHDVVKLLLPQFRDSRHSSGMQLVHETSKIILAAARCGDPVLVSRLLDDFWGDGEGAPPDLREEILFEAVYMGRIEVVRTMLDKGVGANIQRMTMLSSWPRPLWTAQYSPLQVAAFRGRTDVAKLLLDRGANLEFCGGRGEKDLPMYYAASGGYETTVQLLLDYGVHMDKKGRKFEAAANRYILEDVARSNQVHIVRLLLENGASFEKPSRSSRKESIGESSLNIAIEHGNMSMVLCLLEFGVTVKTLGRKLELVSIAEKSSRAQISKALLNLKVEDANLARNFLERMTNISRRGAPITRIKILKMESVESESILFHSQGRY
jgi:ankyrin repeat protein